MNIYITTGTVDFLKKLEKQYSNEAMITMVNENGALLLHETNGTTLFKEPRKYQVVESIGQLNKEGFVVIDYIPVTDEGRSLFEHQVKQYLQGIKDTAEFTVFRLLRPLESSTYLILTIWDKESLYQEWEQSNSFLATNKNQFVSINTQSNMFTSAPYKSKYTITD